MNIENMSDNINMAFWGDVKIDKMFDIHDNEKVAIYAKGLDEEKESQEAGCATKKGPHEQQLFCDEQTKKREKERFLRFLSEHKMGNRSLVCKKNDTLNDVVVCFLMEWRERKLVSQSPSGGAIFRFLTKDCELFTEVTEKSYSNKIKDKFLEKNYSIDIYRKVKKYF